MQNETREYNVESEKMIQLSNSNTEIQTLNSSIAIFFGFSNSQFCLFLKIVLSLIKIKMSAIVDSC